MEDPYEQLLAFASEIKDFFVELTKYLIKNLHLSFIKFEAGKGIFVTALYRQRGKLSRRLMHTGMATLAALGIMIAPVVAQEFPGRSVDPWNIPSPSAVLSASTEDPETSTQISDKVRDKIYQYTVNPGDTISAVAQKFDISEDTIRWQNSLSKNQTIKAGQVLEILPVTGVSHKVVKGDTVYSIAKRYDTSAQAVVDFPYNTFVNDETFELAVGQKIVVPDGVKPAEIPAAPRARQTTPDAGTVVASGQFVWPTNGIITQRFAWYHPGVDIANPAAPSVLAADSGKVVVSGWVDNSGYGNRIEIDHGNGTRTRYAHLSQSYVTVGQSVRRGDAIGRMGSTGRSTGTHLHFEIIRGGIYLNPLNILK